MSQHRSAVPRIVVPRRRRWVIGAVGALGASGLILGGVGFPVSADDVTGGVKPHASAGVQDDCVTAAAGTGEADGSAQTQGAGAQLQATGEGTATVSVCVDDLPPSGDPGGSVPGPDDLVPGDLPDGSVAGEVVGVVTAVVEGGLPGDGNGPLPGDPGGGLPGLDDGFPADPGDVIPGGPGGGGPGSELPDDPEDLVPGGLGGLVPDGSGVDPGNILDRLAEIVPGAIDDGGTPGGNGGGRPAVNTSTTGSGSGSVAVSGEGAEQGAPPDLVLGTELERGGPASGDPGAAAPGGSLPRTGGGLGNGVLRLIAVLGLGRVMIGLANRGRLAVGDDRT